MTPSYLSEMPDGIELSPYDPDFDQELETDGIELSPYDPDFDQELETARAVMRRYRNALRKLAK